MAQNIQALYLLVRFCIRKQMRLEVSTGMKVDENADDTNRKWCLAVSVRTFDTTFDVGKLCPVLRGRPPLRGDA